MFNIRSSLSEYDGHRRSFVIPAEAGIQFPPSSGLGRIVQSVSGAVP